MTKSRRISSYLMKYFRSHLLTFIYDILHLDRLQIISVIKYKIEEIMALRSGVEAPDFEVIKSKLEKLS